MLEIVLVATVLSFFCVSAIAGRTDVALKSACIKPKAGALPEDAVLKRHFIGQLRSEIVAGLPPCPTDSVLRRHYDALLASRLSQRLQALTR